MKYTMTCAICGAEFKSTRSNAKYCSDECRGKRSHHKKVTVAAEPVLTKAPVLVKVLEEPDEVALPDAAEETTLEIVEIQEVQEVQVVFPMRQGEHRHRKPQGKAELRRGAL